MMNNYTKKLFFPISETVNLAAKGHPTLYCSVKYRNSNLGGKALQLCL